MRPLVVLILLSGFISVSSAPSLAATVSYPQSFSSGWNLAGNSLNTSIDVKTAFGTQANVQTVWKWNASGSTWAFYAPSLDAAGSLTNYATSKGYSVLTTINPGEGFWVNASSASVSQSSQSGTGFSLSASSLATGWNLVATGENISPATFSANIGNITTMWGWDNATNAWFFYAPSLAVNNTLAGYISSKNYKDFGTLTLGNGLGFWINHATPASPATTFTGAATPGELLTYTMDAANLTYSYTIVESQYGLTGKTGSGALVANADGSYSLSGVPNSKAVILKNGMLIAAIRENFSGVTKTVPVFAVSNPLSTLTAAAAIYNYESYQCPTTNCSTTAAYTSYGTFQINGNGTWIACDKANYATNPLACVGGASDGTLTSLGAGKWQLNGNTGQVIGTALAYTAANGQNVMMIDLHDPVNYGYGIVVGSSQAVITASDVNGTWISGMYGELNGSPVYGHDVATVTGGNSILISNQVLNGVTQPNSTATFTINSPWNGLVQFSTGGSPGLMAGTGMFVSSDSGAAGSIFEIAFKM